MRWKVMFCDWENSCSLRSANAPSSFVSEMAPIALGDDVDGLTDGTSVVLVGFGQSIKGDLSSAGVRNRAFAPITHSCDRLLGIGDARRGFCGWRHRRRGAVPQSPRRRDGVRSRAAMRAAGMGDSHRALRAVDPLVLGRSGRHDVRFDVPARLVLRVHAARGRRRAGAPCSAPCRRRLVHARALTRWWSAVAARARRVCERQKANFTPISGERVTWNTGSGKMRFIAMFTANFGVGRIHTPRPAPTNAGPTSL